MGKCNWSCKRIWSLKSVDFFAFYNKCLVLGSEINSGKKNIDNRRKAVKETIMDKFKKVQEVIASVEADVTKFYDGGNAAAGTRVRG